MSWLLKRRTMAHHFLWMREKRSSKWLMRRWPMTLAVSSVRTCSALLLLRIRTYIHSEPAQLSRHPSPAAMPWTAHRAARAPWLLTATRCTAIFSLIDRICSKWAKRQMWLIRSLAMPNRRLAMKKTHISDLGVALRFLQKTRKTPTSTILMHQVSQERHIRTSQRLLIS